jgi:predicted nucleic acid-binding protein
MSLTIFDTDILINVGRGDAEAIDCLQNHSQTSTLAISVVTQMELLVGCRNKTEQQILAKFLKQFQILEINEQISDRAVKLLERYRLSHGLLIADSLIAATAIENNEDFISKNQKDFRFITGLKLLSFP